MAMISKHYIDLIRNTSFGYFDQKTQTSAAEGCYSANLESIS